MSMGGFKAIGFLKGITESKSSSREHKIATVRRLRPGSRPSRIREKKGTRKKSR